MNALLEYFNMNVYSDAPIYVTGPAKINHVSANYTQLDIHEYL